MFYVCILIEVPKKQEKRVLPKAAASFYVL